jgi:fumigallin biosynthesis monooxygenase-like protein
MIDRARIAAKMDGEFVLFLIGMRFNRLWKIGSWWPVATAMPRMLRELGKHPELGCLGGNLWFGRTTILVQYWRSFGHLDAYSRNRDAEHLPAWVAFNKRVGTSGDVGIWHETYHVTPGHYENIYVNMPPFGLGAVGIREPATGAKKSAADRIRDTSVSDKFPR